MNQFKTVFFGGYCKEQVDEYIGSLLVQIEQMKKRMQRMQQMEDDEKKRQNELNGIAGNSDGDEEA